MSDFTTTTTDTNNHNQGAHTATRGAHDNGNQSFGPARRISSETKPSFKTTELIAYVAAVLGVLIASAIVDASDFGPQEAWRFITFLTIGYMISRGLAKSGSRNFSDDSDSNHDGR